jgi:glycosyltransferase involved in cell wall biosynthesis
LSIKDISVFIIAKDAQDTIEETLSSLIPFDEVILYLNSSSDNTQKIAQKYENVKIVHGEFIGFGPTKNQAANCAKNEWVLSLDSDEVLTEDLINEIRSVNLSDKKVVYELKRDNYLLGKKVRFSGWGKDFLVRLYNKEYHAFNDNLVHEFVSLRKESQKICLQASFKHNAVNDINQFLQKIIKYSDIASKDKKTCCYMVVVLKSFFAFFKTYFIQLGFLDGWRGFLIAISNFTGKFFRYTKRYINCKER